MPNSFAYDQTHGVAICRDCGSCVVPGAASLERHLRAKPHRLAGDVLKTTVQLLSSYALRPVEELKRRKPRREDRCPRIPHLAAYDGYSYL